LARKRGSRRRTTTGFSENVVVMETRYQMLKGLSFCNRSMLLFCKQQIKISVVTFIVKKGEMKLFGFSIFVGMREKIFRSRI